MARSKKIEQLVKRNSVAKRVSSRFVAGERIEDVIEPVRVINARGMTATMDYLGENVASPAEAEQSSTTYVDLLKAIHASNLNANVSLKLTQFGLDLSDDIAYGNVARVVDQARRLDNFVRMDIEGSDYTQRTFDMQFRLWETRKNVGTAIQSYLFRSKDDVNRMNEAGCRVRLIKGAYQEPASISYQAKVDVDNNFVVLMKMLLEHGTYPAIATHDPAMISATQTFAKDKGISSDRYEFQMLYGIRRDLQQKLVDDGYRMRVYVPFGTQWYPYFMRRLAERPANLWFVVKNIFRH